LLDLGSVTKGWFFGELGLLRGILHTAFVYANSTVLDCYTLDKELFKTQLPADVKEYFVNYITSFYPPLEVSA
jgi:hypothetical protein